jgi:glycerol-3-phosphate dehydrogenase
VRRPAPRELDRTFDLVVVGGGTTGASTAPDAALRGLSVLLLEREDFAAGTSSRSTKLLHGGLRYLQTYQFRLVRESVRERELMLGLAPHLAHVRPFIYALYDGDPEGRHRLHAGLTVYDLFSGSPLERRHRMLDARGVLEHEPHLDPRGLAGGGLYQDVLTDDARITVDTVKGAAAAGALVLNHAEVRSLRRTGGAATEVVVADRLGGGELAVTGRVVLNAAGPWIDEVRRLESPGAPGMLGPTKGVHVVLRTADFPLRNAVFLRSPRDDRVVWPIPSLEDGLVYVGTTDTRYTGSLDEVVAGEEDVEYLLEVANRTIPDARVDVSHVVGTWAGLRPLIAPAGETAESAVSREHAIVRGPAGVLTIAGGKLTTARVMALQLVDAAVRVLAEEHGIRGVPPSRSREVPIAGGDPAGIFRARREIAELGLDPRVARRWERYGSDGAALADRVRADPAAGERLGGTDLTRAELHHAVEAEMAATLADVLVRRTSTFFWSADGGVGAIEPVAGELARLLSWSDATRAREIDGYTAWVRANRPSRATIPA